VRRAVKLWVQAQRDFEQRFGAKRSAALRALLSEVVACNLDAPFAASASHAQQAVPVQRNAARK